MPSGLKKAQNGSPRTLAPALKPKAQPTKKKAYGYKEIESRRQKRLNEDIYTNARTNPVIMEARDTEENNDSY